MHFPDRFGGLALNDEFQMPLAILCCCSRYQSAVDRTLFNDVPSKSNLSGKPAASHAARNFACLSMTFLDGSLLISAMFALDLGLDAGSVPIPVENLKAYSPEKA